jgi:galactokinase
MPRFRAPGRVNLIGGQVDYHEGLVVSLAIDRDVVVDARPRTDARVVARSVDLDGIVDVAADGSDDPASIRPPWGRPVGGVLRVLAAAGRLPVGADISTSSAVPVGAGLSSSAAFEVAVALALGEVAGFALSGRELARACQEAEHIALGVPCGIQDQLTSVMARAGHAVLLDCRTLEIEHLAIPRDIGIVVVHSGVGRTLEGSPWASRRAESLAVAAQLGLRVLRDATPGQVAGLPRGRHVVSEIARVEAFAAALRAGDVGTLGALLVASHQSSRDDMEVSIPALDTLVECLVAAGAYGARLTGGGFGGCVVALAPAASAAEIAARASAEYRSRTGREPTPWIVAAAAGASTC